jgi:hypothetical protein
MFDSCPLQVHIDWSASAISAILSQYQMVDQLFKDAAVYSKQEQILYIPKLKRTKDGEHPDPKLLLTAPDPRHHTSATINAPPLARRPPAPQTALIPPAGGASLVAPPSLVPHHTWVKRLIGATGRKCSWSLSSAGSTEGEVAFLLLALVKFREFLLLATFNF